MTRSARGWLEAPRPAIRSGRRYVLEDRGFDEVPKKYRRFYRNVAGSRGRPRAERVLCPVCKVVIRSTRELRPGDRVYCMPCMSRLVVVRAESGMLRGARRLLSRGCDPGCRLGRGCLGRRGRRIASERGLGADRGDQMVQVRGRRPNRR
jgi:hypothetical protein